MVHTTKDVAVAHPPHGAARDQNIVLDIPVFSSGTLPRCQMRMVVLEEGVGVLEVEGCGQIKQAGTIVWWLGRTPMQMEFANDATLLLPSAAQLRIEVPQDN